MIAAFQVMAQAIQIQKREMTSVTSFYKRIRKANVPTFCGNVEPEKSDNWIRDME